MIVGVAAKSVMCVDTFVVTMSIELIFYLDIHLPPTYVYVTRVSV